MSSKKRVIMKLDSKIWTIEPGCVKNLIYEYEEKERFLNKAADVVAEIINSYHHFQFHFTENDTSLEKAMWMLHRDALSAINDCIEFLKNRKYRTVFKLLRDIFEAIDLATLFWLTKKEKNKYLNKWYKGKVFTHRTFRQYIEKKLGNKNLSDSSKELYGIFSEDLHHTYQALSKSYLLGAGNKIWFDTEEELSLPQRITEAMWLLGKMIATLVYYCALIIDNEQIKSVKSEFSNKDVFKHCLILSK